MASDQNDTSTNENKQLPIEVNDWNGLNQQAQLLCQGSDKNVKICLIDEEQEEIRLQNQDEFDLNVQYARDHEIKSLTFVVYIDNKHVFNGIYNIEKLTEKLAFPTDKLQMLIDNVLVEKWYIPVKQDEPFGVCLSAAIDLAQNGKLDTNPDCKQFIETIIPEALRKLQNTESVFSWPREIQCGIFEIIELFVDLVGTRICYPPIPITLLKTLAMTFDTDMKFSQKHKNELLPPRRSYTLKDEDFLREDFDKETFGWLRSIIQRFIAQNGLKNIRLQFEYIDSSNSTTTTMEYTALLKVFAKCNKCINTNRFRLIFHRPIRQAIQYLQKQNASNEDNNELKELNETLMDICYKYELKDEIKNLLALPYNSNIYKISSSSVESCSETTPLIEVPISVQRKTKNQDCYERLAEDIRSMTINNGDGERKNIKKQRTDEQTPSSLFTRNSIMECIDDLLTTTDKRSLKRKHRREQQRSTLLSTNNGHINKKESKRSNTITIATTKNYDRSNPEDILRYFAPMKLKIATLYDNLHTLTCQGNLREVLKIEEKLKILRPFSARFIADENTPDGTLMQPGQVFRKGWILLNDGSLPWDSNDIQLINLSDGIQVLQQPIVPITAPHARAVINIDFMCPNKSGTYESKWILAYRQQTFGPMIWCSIEVNQASVAIENKIEPIIDDNEFEFIEVPLPACFDLSKPYQSLMKTSSDSSLNLDFVLPCIDSTELLATDFSTVNIDNLQSSYASDSDSFSTFTCSSSMPSLVENQINKTSLPTDSTSEDPTPLIELAPPTETQITTPIISVDINNDERQSARLNQSLDFVDTVVTNIFSVAKQAGSTAKAIFNTLQAYDEPIPSTTTTTTTVQDQQPSLVNTFNKTSINTNGLFEHINSTQPIRTNSFTSDDQMKTLIEMGFANRAKNQRLLRENANDLAKVIELLTLETNDEVDWLRHKSILETYGLVSNEESSLNENERTTSDTSYPPVRQRTERERPRSIRLKPQEYLLIAIAILAILSLVIYNIFQYFLPNE
ncbi:unnamed protein product [Adineta steineri]|uniref:UBA domain-containing protein n=1 Tax=Adineta steineri TaxID=433720 RepID=A0A813QFG9_9BILA|nr:unnamed protein product [Adineta steineri]